MFREDGAAFSPLCIKEDVTSRSLPLVRTRKITRNHCYFPGMAVKVQDLRTLCKSGGGAGMSLLSAFTSPAGLRPEQEPKDWSRIIAWDSLPRAAFVLPAPRSLRNFTCRLHLKTQCSGCSENDVLLGPEKLAIGSVARPSSAPRVCRPRRAVMRHHLDAACFPWQAAHEPSLTKVTEWWLGGRRESSAWQNAPRPL